MQWVGLKDYLLQLVSGIAVHLVLLQNVIKRHGNDSEYSCKERQSATVMGMVVFHNAPRAGVYSYHRNGSEQRSLNSSV